MFTAFLICWAAITWLAYVLYRMELAGQAHRREPARTAGGALVSQGQYVALAYGAVFVLVLVWVAIIATKLARLERETGELAELARGRRTDG